MKESGYTQPTLTERAERLRIEVAKAGGLPLLAKAAKAEELIADCADLLRDMARKMEGGDHA